MRGVLNLDKILVSFAVIVHDDEAKQSGTDMFRSRISGRIRIIILQRNANILCVAVTLTILKPKLY